MIALSFFINDSSLNCLSSGTKSVKWHGDSPLEKRRNFFYRSVLLIGHQSSVAQLTKLAPRALSLESRSGIANRVVKSVQWVWERAILHGTKQRNVHSMPFVKQERVNHFWMHWLIASEWCVAKLANRSHERLFAVTNSVSLLVYRGSIDYNKRAPMHYLLFPNLWSILH